jgi:predicted MFS family arabinose efflux permease
VTRPAANAGAVRAIEHDPRTRRGAANRLLVGVYAQFAAVNLVFYAVFFGLPLWLEEARRFAPATAGLLLLPVVGVGVLATPLAARLIDRSGPRGALIVGAVLLLTGSLLLLLFDAATPVPALLAVGAVLGVPNGFNTLGLQTALYETAPARQMGAAGGLFQTFRYTGAILSTALIGLVLGPRATSGHLHTLAIVCAVVSTLLAVTSILTRRSSGGTSPPPASPRDSPLVRRPAATPSPST